MAGWHLPLPDGKYFPRAGQGKAASLPLQCAMPVHLGECVCKGGGGGTVEVVCRRVKGKGWVGAVVSESSCGLNPWHLQGTSFISGILDPLSSVSSRPQVS